MFKLVISPQAQKELKAISKIHQKVIRLALIDLKEDPLAGKPLARDLLGKFSYRVGLYRIIYRVSFKDKIVYILTAGHRSKVYN